MLVTIREQHYVSEPIETKCLNLTVDSIRELWDLAVSRLGRVRILKWG
jgi:hypothetical protein